MNAGGTISVGLGARGLRDRDYLSKSDPYLVLARPSASGGFHILRTSETKKNCLSPDWADFLLRESELGPQDLDLRLRLEVFDNDYGSRDQLLGVAHLSLRQLEAAATLRSPLPLGDGKGRTKAGQLVVRSFSRHQGQGGGHPAQGGGYHAQGGGYPGQGGGYPSQGGGHPALGGGYPAQPVGYASPANLPYPAQPAQGMPGVYYPPQQPQGPARPNGHPQAQPYPTSGHTATFAPSPHTGPYPPTGGPYQQPPLYPSLPTVSPSAPPATHDYPTTPAYPQPTPAYPQPTPAYPQPTPAYPQPATYNGPGGFVTRPR